MPNYLLEMRNITKIFPGVRALDNVSFTLKKGEIHALMGENGAGKSTFIKVLTGVHRPDGGEIILDGKKIEMHDPLVAAKHGIAAIYQHLALYPDLTVAENIFMGHEKLTKMRSIRWRDTNKAARELLESLGSSISPTERMGSLSVAQQLNGDELIVLFAAQLFAHEGRNEAAEVTSAAGAADDHVGLDAVFVHRDFAFHADDGLMEKHLI